MMTRSMFIRLTVGILHLVVPLVSVGAGDRAQEWIDILQSDAPVFEKVRACQQLGEYGSKEAVPALAVLINHPQLSTYARTGLERIPGPESRNALRQALQQTQGTVRIGVIHSLAAIRDEKAVPALTNLTADSDDKLAQAALLALGRIATDEAVTRVRQALQSGPARLRPEAAAACLLAAESQLQQGRADTARALYDEVRQAQVPASYRIGATRGAIVTRNGDRVPFLLQQLRSKDPALRNVALLTIREIPSDALAAALNTELERAPRDLQLQLMVALKDCHDAQSLRVLSSKASSPDPELRLVALKVLKDIGAPESAATLLKVLSENRTPEEVAVAVSALEIMGGSEVEATILEALQASADSRACVQLIQVLDARQVAEAKEALLRLAASPDAKVCAAAFQALKSLASLEDLPTLIDLTKAVQPGPARDGAVAAIYSVCKQGEQTERAGALLLRELKASDTTEDKLCWVRVLAPLGYAAALPVMTGALGDADPDLVRGTITQLARWPDPSPINDLFKLVEEGANPSIRTRALLAALQLATSAADRNQARDETLLAWFKRAHGAAQSTQVKRLLISGLGRVHHIDAVQLLTSYLNDPAVKLEAVHAIVSAAGPLAKGPDGKAVEAVLGQISGVQDQRLLGQIRQLQQDIRSAQSGLNP